MIDNLMIERKTGNGRYADVLDVAAYIGTIRDGSASNAAHNMIRESSTFKKTIKDQDFKAWRAKYAESQGSGRDWRSTDSP